MKEFVEKIINQLDELIKIESDKSYKYAKLNMDDYAIKHNYGEICYTKVKIIIQKMVEELES